MQVLFPILIIVVLGACNTTTNSDDTKHLDFGVFSITTPKTWDQIKVKGIDSDVGRIVINGEDTLDFDYGWYSNSLTEIDPPIVERFMLQHYQKPFDTTEIILVDSRKGIDLDRYRKQNVSWDTIDGYNAKIVYPRKSGIGITGVYIDSVRISGSDVNRFNLYGENLNPENEREVLQAIRTIKFKKK